MDIRRNDYVARVASATPAQMIVINYEILLDFIAAARENAGTDQNSFITNIKKAQTALENLMDSLDMGYEISRELMPIYIYCNKLLMQAYFSKDTQALEEVSILIAELLAGWNKAEQQDSESPPVMEQTRRIFAGLTYRKDGLEEYIPEDSGKDYQV